MAWNQPTGAAQPPRKAPSKLRGLVAPLMLVALAGGAAWYLLMPADRKEMRSRHSGFALGFPLASLAPQNKFLGGYDL